MSTQPETLKPLSSPFDGDGAGDHDEPYRFGRRPTTRAPYPFSERQFARLLILRGRVRDNVNYSARNAEPAA